MSVIFNFIVSSISKNSIKLLLSIDMKNFDRLERLIWENSCEIGLPKTPSRQDAWKALIKRISSNTNLIEPIKVKKEKSNNILNWL